ncbi:putative disease resistance protein At1g50180 [Herrania umbratica]|uniref:Disease resistance protein At1g50180 n=1 Tax=Herrania umbratica TaxID=108875 RepID=A0A6J1BAZ0_9ROSI|nr:putative disease resistance protein At1g50180 [Herrania umbratica]XP_021296637.1 putative disease resistance protein At1g50180 [Herrania umbratica]
MAESVVSFLVERLADLLIQEASLLWGVEDQVRQMHIELKRMQCFLKDADKRQDEDESVRNWVSEIRDAAYDVEDVIDNFIVKFASKKGGKIRNTVIQGKELHNLASEIERIKSRISDLTRSLQTYGITARKGEGSSYASERQRQLRWSYSHLVEEHIVGFDENIAVLIKKLVPEEERCRVVSICGMGGLGKTTLAKTLYHHADIRRHFEAFAWAYVSQQCRRRDVWEGILLKLITPSKEEKEEILRMRDDELAKKLYKVQLQKRCLIVIDDIWTTEAWETLQPAFPKETTVGSKILLTSRNKEVALGADLSRFLHEPQCLNEEKSWELFQRKAFPWKHESGFTVNKDMENLGREMVGSCAGLPLAIIVLGGLLATKETVNEWDMVHRNIKSHLARSQGRGEQARLSEVLALSYHELPYQLKPCFLYLSQFPEDFDIPTKKLVQQWVAEGIVSSQDEKEVDGTMEEVAKSYLRDLINRSMVQLGVRGSTGTIKTCRLHDLMRDLCLSKAKQENFFDIIDHADGNKTNGDVRSSGYSKTMSASRIRRCAIHLSHVQEPVLPEYQKNPNLRSLFFFRPKKHRLHDGRLLKSVFDKFKLLKVLDLEGIKGLDEKLPKDVGALIQLRFLSLKKTRIRELPSSLVNLVGLQTLNLQTIDKVSWESTVQVPNMIWKMDQLRHLYLPKWCGNVTDKLTLANLSNLQTLANFPANKCDVRDLLRLTNLQKLVLNDPRHFETFVEIFEPPNNTLQYLMSLSLKTDLLSFPNKVVNLRRLLSGCPRLSKLHVEGRIDNLPKNNQFPSSLTKLTLWGSRLGEDPMEALGKLPYLKYFSGWEVFIGKKMICSKDTFPQLKTLLLRGLPNFEEWTIEEGAMPTLSRLGVSDCYKLKMVPDGLRFITTLRELEIRWMSRAFKSSLEEDGEDFYKVQHVPSIVFSN